MSASEAREQSAAAAGEQLAEFEKLLTAALPDVVSEALGADAGSVYRPVMACLEGPLLRHVLDLAGGNQVKAARLLGINRNTLRKRLRLLGLRPSPRGGASS